SRSQTRPFRPSRERSAGARVPSVPSPDCSSPGIGHGPGGPRRWRVPSAAATSAPRPYSPPQEEIQAMLKTLFHSPPSYEGFDGGAGARYQNRKEVRSFWYPTWLAQPAALVPGSRLIDAPPHDLTVEDVLQAAGDADGTGQPYDLCIINTSTPTF